MNFIDIFYQPGGWVYSSILAAFVSAFLMLTNQYFKQSGGAMVLVFRIIVAIILLPFMFYVEIPKTWTFYIALLIAASSGGMADIRTVNLVAKYGGGMVSRMRPLVIFLTFPLWFFFDNALFFKYLEHPAKSTAIVLALIGCAYFASRFKKCEINKAAIKDMLPALVAYSVASIASKIAAMQGGYQQIVIPYLCIQSIMITPIIATYLAFTDKAQLKMKVILDKRMLQAAGSFAFFWMMAVALQVISLANVPNPAYYGAIGQLSPVIISLIYLAVGHKEKGDVVSGFGIVLCAVAISLLSV